MKPETDKLLAKADRSIEAAEVLLRAGDPDFAASRAYYAMLYTAQALLHEDGLQLQRHGGVHGAFGERFVKSGLLDKTYHRRLLDAYDRRVIGDYQVDATLTTADAQQMIEHAREFVQEARRFLASRP